MSADNILVVVVCLQRVATDSLSGIFANADVRSMVNRQFDSADDFNNEIMRETGFARNPMLLIYE